MWYFAWILGVLLASACAIINVLWLEMVAKDVFRGENDEEFPNSEQSDKESHGSSE